jgi:hypothetical protein
MGFMLEIIKPRIWKRRLTPNNPDIRASLRLFFWLDEDGESATSQREEPRLISDELRDEVQQLTQIDEDALSSLEIPETARELITRMYHYRHARNRSKIWESMDEENRAQIELALDFMETEFGQEYDEADALFAAGLVTNLYLSKLFPPN